MVEFIEIDTLDSGEIKEFKRQFASKFQLLKMLRKMGIPSSAIYDLNKSNESEFHFKGAKRTLKIVNVDE